MVRLFIGAIKRHEKAKGIIMKVAVKKELLICEKCMCANLHNGEHGQSLDFNWNAVSQLETRYNGKLIAPAFWTTKLNQKCECCGVTATIIMYGAKIIEVHK